jgi:cytosine/creatinine deaminase
LSYNGDLATNDVLNRFTPFGDAGSFAWRASTPTSRRSAGPQISRPCFGLVTTLPARRINATDYGIAAGIPPTWSRSTAATQAMAVAELAQPLLGLEPGRRSFSRPRGDHPSSDRPIRVLLTKSAIA